jgi:hypothetical protein
MLYGILYNAPVLVFALGMLLAALVARFARASGFSVASAEDAPPLEIHADALGAISPADIQAIAESPTEPIYEAFRRRAPAAAARRLCLFLEDRPAAGPVPRRLRVWLAETRGAETIHRAYLGSIAPQEPGAHGEVVRVFRNLKTSELVDAGRAGELRRALVAQLDAVRAQSRA